MMGRRCCVCSKERPEDACVVLRLTEDEKAAVKAMGQEAAETYTYCRPCFRVLSNPEQGAQLIRGVFQHTLKAEGVPNAEIQAQRYYNLLISKARRMV